MPDLNRRTFLASVSAAAVVRAAPAIQRLAPQRRVLTLVWDKALGAMRAIDRAVP